MRACTRFFWRHFGGHYSTGRLMSTPPVTCTTSYHNWVHCVSPVSSLTTTRTYNLTSRSNNITTKHEILLLSHSYDFTVSQPVYHGNLQLLTVSPPVLILTQYFPLVFPWGRTGETLGTVSTTASAAVLPQIYQPSLQWSPRGLPPPRGWL